MHLTVSNNSAVPPNPPARLPPRRDPIGKGREGEKTGKDTQQVEPPRLHALSTPPAPLLPRSLATHRLMEPRPAFNSEAQLGAGIGRVSVHKSVRGRSRDDLRCIGTSRGYSCRRLQSRTCPGQPALQRPPCETAKGQLQC